MYIINMYYFHPHLTVKKTKSERLTEGWNMAAKAGHRPKVNSALTRREWISSGHSEWETTGRGIY